MRILIDGFNLSLDKGTGVSTYARNLTSSLKESGHEVELLYGLPISGVKQDLLKEVSFFDNPEARRIANNRVDSTLGLFWASIRAFLKVPKPIKIPISGRVEARQFASRLPPNDGIWNIPEIFITSHLYFKVTGKFLQIKFDSPPDVAHWTYPLPLKVAGAKNIYTIHDLIPLKLPFTTLDSKRDYLKLCKKIAADADCVVTVSENSKRDICELLGARQDRVVNTYQSVSLPEKAVSIPEEELRSILLNLYKLHYKNYFLFVGAIEPKKNIGRLLEAYLGSDIDAPLVIVGPNAWMYEKELASWDPEATSGLQVSGDKISKTQRIVKLDYVSFPNLINLIRGAQCLVFPSLYEGFGLPVLEAMMLGTPVITSNTSSLPEVTGDAARLVDPYDVMDIRKALSDLHKQGSLDAMVLAGQAQAKKFSPDAIMPNISNLYSQFTPPNKPD